MQKKSLFASIAVGIMLMASSVTAAFADGINFNAVKSKSLMGSPEATVRFRVGTTTAPDGHYVKGLQEMQRLLELYSQGEMTLDIYPNSLLGDERGMMELVGLGIQDMCLISTGPIPNFAPDFSVLDLPYLFEDEAAAYAGMDGPVGDKLLAELSKFDIKGLGFWENGFRHLTNGKVPVKHPSELAGLKIRTMENTIHIATYELLGALATPMAWSEIFTALQQGTVDGQENPIAIIETAKVYEVQPYLSMIGLFYSPCVLMVSQKTFDRLSPEQQEIFLRASEEAKHFQRQYSMDYNAVAIEKMKAAGVQIIDVDLDEWKKAVQPIYDMHEELKVNMDLVKMLTEPAESAPAA